MVFSGGLIAFIAYEPIALCSRWLKTRTWFEIFPLLRREERERRQRVEEGEIVTILGANGAGADVIQTRRKRLHRRMGWRIYRNRRRKPPGTGSS